MEFPSFKSSSVSIELCSQCSTTLSRDTLSIPLDAIRLHVLPTASQAQDIHRASDADLASISAFAEAISRTQALLEDLRAKQEALAQSLARKRTLFTIISLAVARTFRHKHDSSLVLRHPVLRLWADVVLYPLYDHSWGYTLRECLQLSESLPVDVSIKRDCPPWRGDDSFSSFRKYDKSGWQHAADAMLGALPNEPTTSTPPLSEVGQVDLTLLFGHCLRLSRLYLANVDPAALPVKWAQLTELSLWMVARGELRDLTTCIDTLHLCPNLEVLALTQQDEVRLCLASLRVLELRYHASWLLDRLIVPGLQELRLANPLQDFGRSMHSLTSPVYSRSSRYCVCDHRGVRRARTEGATRVVEIEAHQARLDFHSQRSDPIRHSGVGIYKGGNMKLMQHPHLEADKFLLDLVKNRLDSADWTLYYEDEDGADQDGR
ncbi:hypothetical protein K523DRAFT_368639 [Schizophyllum commune Tattone D]|nr:hypothetical protein K523DRAFT_368639 [Schizophyllum commune Tattone D]